MLKIGKTPFRNTEFIYYGFEKVAEEINNKFKVYTDYPSKLGDMLVEGELDIAPASSITYAKHPGKLLILPDISISAQGKTNSILLFSKLSSLDDLHGKTIALPFTSASSNALIEIILKLKKIDVKFLYNQEPNIEKMLRTSDAGLLIGDDALRAFSRENLLLADLGLEWQKLTGKSMVYALWLVNKETAQQKYKEIREFSVQLSRAKKYAYKNIDIISRELASQISLDREFLKKHLSYLSYDLEDNEKEGLLEYFKLAKKFKIINKIPGLEFFKI